MPRLIEPPAVHCAECGEPATVANVTHMYGYDHNEPVRLIGIREVKCGREPEIHAFREFPRIMQLHRVLKKELAIHVDRSKVAFVFRLGPNGRIADGQWSLVLVGKQ